MQAALGDFTDDKTGDLDAGFVDETGGITEQRPDDRTFLSAHPFGDEAIGHRTQRQDGEGGEADFERRADGLHG
ncbi:MAG: hypothetical protein U0787_21080 [Polyangia bacterium]